MRYGLKLCSEERTAKDLVGDAVLAEEAGFDFAAISDHLHPWIDAQGESPFVWSALGAIAARTDRIEVGTAVTCPTIRTHPVTVAHAAATTATMMPGRFFLGVGTGERLNEHVTGARWPHADERRQMLHEAVDVIRQLWSGDTITHRGRHYTVEGARLYSIPERPPTVMVAAGGEESATLAAEIGDGLIGTAPDGELLAEYRDRGGRGRAYAEITICWGDDPEEGLRTALERWPNAAMPSAVNAELATPSHFEQVARSVRIDDLRGSVVTGPAAEPYVDAVRAYAEAGYDGVWFHQIGADQHGFTAFADKELLPALTAS